jgi:hypothetical protein
MLQCRVLVMSLVGVGEGPMQCQLKCTGKQNPLRWNRFGPARRGRGGFMARSSSLGLRIWFSSWTPAACRLRP